MDLLYNMYINSTGYSCASQDYVLALLRHRPDIDVRIKALNSAITVGISRNRQQIFAGLTKKKEADNQACVFHSIPHRYRRDTGAKKHIGFAIFETINPPKDWIKMMNNMDSIITASSFNENIFRSAGTTIPISVVPHCFDPHLFNRDTKDKGRYDLFTFLAIGTWKQRKNWDTLIKSFYDAFSKNDGVCLLVKTDKPQQFETRVQQIKKDGEWRSKDTAPIYVDNKTHIPFEDIPSFMKKGDVYINISLGEGFSLPSLHAMALGIPVLVTKYGGLLEFVKPGLGTFVDPDQYRTYPHMDGIPQFRNCIWPVLKIGSVRDKMIEIKNKYPKEMTKLAYEYVHTNFCYETIANKFASAIV